MNMGRMKLNLLILMMKSHAKLPTYRMVEMHSVKREKGKCVQ